MKVAPRLVAAAALVFGLVNQLPADTPSDVLTDTDGISGFELYGDGIYWWDAPGVCSGEFANQAAIRLREASVFAETKTLAQACDMLQNVNANVVRDDLNVYFYANGRLVRKALSASEADPAIVMAGPYSDGPAAFYLELAKGAGEFAKGVLYWDLLEEAGLWKDGDFYYNVSYDLHSSVEGEVRKMKYFTFETVEPIYYPIGSSPKTVEALAVLTSTSKLYRILVEKVSQGIVPVTLLASGINDFAIHKVFGLNGPSTTWIYAAKGVKQPDFDSKPGSLLRIDPNSGISTVVYTAQGHNQVVAVATDSSGLFFFGQVKNIYLAESVESCVDPKFLGGGPGFCLTSDYVILRNALPGTSGLWNFIVTSGGGINLRSDDEWLYFLEGKAKKTIRRISTDASPIKTYESVNAAPLVNIVNPTNGASFLIGMNIPILAEASDLGGEIRRVEFFAGDRLIGSDSTAPYSVIWANALDGVHDLTARATDNLGLHGTSPVVKIQVGIDVSLDRLPIITVNATDAEAAEPTESDAPPNNGTFTLTRSGDTSAPLRVHYTVSGTAQNGVDYLGLDGDATIQAGSTTHEIFVQPLADRVLEDRETVILNLRPDTAYNFGSPNRATVVIIDPPRPTNNLPVLVIRAPLDSATFTAPAAITIRVTAIDPKGYISAVDFFAGTTKIGESVIAFIRPPDPGTPIEHVLEWRNVPAGKYTLTAKAKDRRATLTSRPVSIQVTEQATPRPVVAVRATDPQASESTGNEAVDTGAFQVFRTGDRRNELFVRYVISGTAANGVDYAELPGRVTIPAGESSAKITVIPIADGIAEPKESVALTLVLPRQSVPPGAFDDYVIGSPNQATVRIQDSSQPEVNQPPTVTILMPQDGERFAAPATIQLMAQAFDRDGWMQTVEFFEGTNSLGVVTNNPRALSPVNPFEIIWTNVPPGDYTLTAKATDNEGATAISPRVRIQVGEVVFQPVVNIVARDPEASENPTGSAMVNTAAFVVSRTGPTDFPLPVYLSICGTAENGVDYRKSRASILIPAGKSEAEILIVPINDSLKEADETVEITVEPPICLPIFPPELCYLVGESNSARAIILDADRVINSPPSVGIISPENGARIGGPANIVIRAEAADPDGSIRKVEFFTDDRLLETDATAPYSFTWQNVPPGKYQLTVKATDNQGATATSQAVVIEVTGGAVAQPVVTVEATDPEAAEPSTISTPVNTGTFTLTRTGDTGSALGVFYSLNGTAANRIDYQYLAGEAIIPAGSRSVEIFVRPFADNAVEGRETAVLTLRPADSYEVGSPRTATVTILDSEGPPANQPPSVSIISPINGASFNAPADIVIRAEAADRDGFVRSVEFFQGTTSLGTVGNNELAPPGLFRFRVTWTNVPPGEYTLTAKATDNLGATATSAAVVIEVTGGAVAQPVVTVEAVDSEAVEPKPSTSTISILNTGSFILRRTGDTSSALEVFYSLGGTAANRLDYQFLESEATIQAGSATAEILVRPLADNAVEGPETVVLTLRAADAYELGSPRTATVTILDSEGPLTNQPPSVSIISPINGASFDAPASIVIAAEAADRDGSVRSVEFFQGASSLGTVFAQPGSSQFRVIWTNVPPGEYTLTAKATDDQGATATSPAVLIEVTGGAVVQPVVTVEATDPEAAEPKPSLISLPVNTGTFTLTRTGDTSSALEVFYSLGGTAANQVDYQFLEGKATIQIGSATAEILVRPLTDTAAEGPETAVLTLSSAGSYEVGSPRTATLTILDSEGPLTNQPPSVSITTPTNGASFSAPANIVIAAEAADPDGFVRSVEFFQGASSLGTVFAQPGSSLFRVSWTNVPAGAYTLTAKATDDQGATATSPAVQIRVVSRRARAQSVDTVEATHPEAASGVRITAFRRLAGGECQLTIASGSGLRIAIEASTDLLTWTRLTVLTGATGTLQYTDTHAKHQDRCFYRAVPVP